MSRVLLVGTATLDLVFGLEHPPAADEEMRARSLRFCRGGNAANSAVVLARLGYAVDFLGVLASAPESALIEHDFAAWGVGFSDCPHLPGRPPTSSIYLSGSSRSIVHYRDLPELDLAHFDGVEMGRYGWVHAEGRNVAVLHAALEQWRVRSPSMPVSIELEKPREGIERLFGLADLLLCSRGFAHHYGHPHADGFLQWMHRQAPDAKVVVAWGESGAYGISPDGDMHHAPAMPPTRIVDTLGAGDTFNAALIAALVEKVSLPEAMSSACRLAGMKCGVEGFSFWLENP